MRLRGFLIALLTAMVALSGCSSDAKAPSGEAARLGDPCRLLKRADVEAALGSPVSDPYDPLRRGGFPPFSVVGMRFCAFDGSLRGRVTLGLTSALATSVFKKYKETPGAQYTSIPGLGDEAVLARGTNLVALRKEYVVGVTFFTSAPQTPYPDQRVIRLMTKALEGLGP